MTKDMKEVLEIAMDSGEFLQMMINNVLDHAKLEAGKLSVSTHSVKLKSFLRKITKLFKAKAHSKEIDLFLKISKNLPENLLIDEQKVSQIMINLVSNAIKFTKKGSVTLRALWIPEGSCKSFSFQSQM
jgi:signal transduction histidine kinase